MIKISAEFASVDFADLAMGSLKEHFNALDVKFKSKKTDNNEDELPIYYPIKPEYLEVSHTQFLEGMPHILSNSPVYIGKEETIREGATISFIVKEELKAAANSLLLSYGAFNINEDDNY